MSDRTAVIYADAHWDYATLARRVATRGGELRAQGVAPGQVVLAEERDPLAFVALQHALVRIGAGLLPVGRDTDPAQRDALVERAGVEWLWQPGEGAVTPTGQPRRHAAQSGLDRDRLAWVIQTSGSAGMPKAAMLTLGNLRASAAAVNRHLALGPGDAWLSCLPRDHVGGLSIAYRCALAGATLVLHQGFDPRRIGVDCDRCRVTHLSLVPPMLARLIDSDIVPPPRLRVALVGGQALDERLARRAIDAGWPLYVTYGMTETSSQIATSDRLAMAPEPGVVAAPTAGIQIDSRPCANDAPRTLRVKGSVVMAGYANPSREPGDGLERGWFATSDLCCITDAGAIRVLGRADEVLVIGGHNVLPSQVEAKLCALSGIDAAVVVGLSEPTWGHMLALGYTGNIDSSDLVHWCREALPSYERPRRIARLDALPLGRSGKVDRQQVRSMLCRDV